MIVASVHDRREEVDAARRLLRGLGQPKCAALGARVRAPRARGAPAPVPAPSPPVAAHRRVEARRRALDRLAYTWPHAQARVNRAMGVTRRADAGERQLDRGLPFLRRALDTLGRLHPEQG